MPEALNEKPEHATQQPAAQKIPRIAKEREISRKEAMPKMQEVTARLTELDVELSAAKTNEAREEVRARMSLLIDSAPLTADWKTGGQGLALNTEESLY